MTTKCANYFYELDNEYLAFKLRDFSKKHGAKHTPSIVAVKAVAGYLGSRQRKRMGFDVEVTNESKAQIFAMTGWSEGSVSDVIKFLEWMGLTKIIRRGGGKNKMPTVRHMITEGPPIEFQSKHRGIISIHKGKRPEHEGINVDQRGELPDTPKDLPIESTRYVYVHESFTSKHTHIYKNMQDYQDQSIHTDLSACVDDESGSEEQQFLAEENSSDISLHQELRDLLISEEVFNFDVNGNLDEYSVTPDDVRDLITHW